MGHHHHHTIVLPLSLTIIFGSFTLGFYVAIQGPTLMDLIDLLHVNNDIMSHSLAVASLAYSVGGLLSGLLFNYVDRQILIPGYYIVFGMANILTPYITNYYIFSVVTVFKMMCAGGTDCGANVWILDMWPGKDAWLQALHFSFAVGCALGPLVVEPFLSANEHLRDGQGQELNFTQGSALINNENGESRIYIPYGVSGSLSLLAAFMIIFLYFLESRRKQAEVQLAVDRGDSPALVCYPQSSGKQSLSGSPEQILMSAVQHPAAIEAGLAINNNQRAASPSHQQQHHHHHQHLHALAVPQTIPEEGVPLTSGTPPDTDPTAGGLIGTASAKSSPSASPQLVRRRASATTPTPTPTPTHTNPQNPAHQEHKQAETLAQQDTQMIIKPANSSTSQLNNQQHDSGSSPILSSSSSSCSATAIQIQQQPTSGQQQQQQQSKSSLQLANFDQIKFTSKAREAEGRPPYYVMLAIALSALCLSFYCGIEITSMNYLATFAVNIDLQLPKSSAALMSSALTISFAVGRLFGIWIAAYMRPHKLFYLCSAVMALGNVFILLFANTAEMLLWASVCLFGIGCGPMYASIVSFYDDKISKVTNTVSGIFILGSMFNVALNTLIIGHYIIDNALILIVCNLIGAVLLLCLFGSLHALTRIKKNQRKRKFRMQQLKLAGVTISGGGGGDTSEKSQNLLSGGGGGGGAAAAAASSAQMLVVAPSSATVTTSGDGHDTKTGSDTLDQQAEQQVALLSDSNSNDETKVDRISGQQQLSTAKQVRGEHQQQQHEQEVEIASPRDKPSDAQDLPAELQPEIGIGSSQVAATTTPSPQHNHHNQNHQSQPSNPSETTAQA